MCHTLGHHHMALGMGAPISPGRKDYITSPKAVIGGLYEGGEVRVLLFKQPGPLG